MIFIPHPAQRQKAALTERQKPFFRSFPIVVPTASLKQAWIGRNRVQLRYSRSFRLHFLCLDTLNKLYLQINYALSLHHFKSRSIHRASQVQNPFPITPATGQEKSIVTCRKGRTESLPARTGGLWSRAKRRHRRHLLLLCLSTHQVLHKGSLHEQTHYILPDHPKAS